VSIAAAHLPTGRVTFLLTDVEGSTKLTIRLGERVAEVLDRHHALLRQAVADAGGLSVSTAGDSLFAVFTTPDAGVAAAVAAQRALAEQPWPDGVRVRVRMGLHTGEAVLGGDDYVGLDVHRTARIAAAGHGGQVLLSEATAHALPHGAAGSGSGVGTEHAGITLRDLGEHHLKDLSTPEHLYQVVISGLPDRFPPLRSEGGRLTLLPSPRTSYVPRPEIAEIERLLPHTQLLTLTGPGGTGKTRLAVEAARRVADDYPGGVAFVDLAAVTEADLVAPTIVTALRLPAGSAPPMERLRAFLDDRRMLLVLDNLEQIPDVAVVVDDLLQQAGRLAVLATSRAPLHLSHEQELPVPPLGPDDAVDLFVQRARRVRPSFTLDGASTVDVRRIVAELDGLPLALELAAARVRMFTPHELADRLASQDATARHLLSSADHDLPSRHRTLDDVIGWSYQLLDAPARTAFRRFAVFAGEVPTEVVEPVLGAADEVIGQLTALTELALLRERVVEGSTRYGMLVTIRSFAVRALDASGEAAEVRRRHAETFAHRAEEAAPHLTGWDQRRWLDRLAAEHDEIRSALAWALQAREADLAHRLAASCWRFWQIRGHLDEGRRHLDATLALPADAAHRARTLEALGGIAYWQGDMPAARRAYEEALCLVEGGEDLAATANARFNAAMAHVFDGAIDQAETELVQAAVEARQAGDARVEAWALWGRSSVGELRGDYPAVVEHAEAALSRFRRLDDPFGIGWALFEAASGTSEQSSATSPQLLAAKAKLQEAVGLFSRFGDVSAIVLLGWSMARVELRLGHPERALRLIGGWRALRRRTGMSLVDENERIMERLGVSTTDLLQESSALADRVPELIAEGEQMSEDEMVAALLER
jgi:predicted ATPase/class 3 adenylate cyclase